MAVPLYTTRRRRSPSGIASTEKLPAKLPDPAYSNVLTGVSTVPLVTTAEIRAAALRTASLASANEMCTPSLLNSVTVNTVTAPAAVRIGAEASDKNLPPTATFEALGSAIKSKSAA